jgi:hypothetical protein
MPNPDQTDVDLTTHTLRCISDGSGSSVIDLFRDLADETERATVSSVNTVKMLKCIQALSTTALAALGE